MNRQANKHLAGAFKNRKSWNGDGGHKGWAKRRVAKQARRGGKALCRGED